MRRRTEQCQQIPGIVASDYKAYFSYNILKYKLGAFLAYQYMSLVKPNRLKSLECRLRKVMQTNASNTIQKRNSCFRSFYLRQRCNIFNRMSFRHCIISIRKWSTSGKVKNIKISILILRTDVGDKRRKFNARAVLTGKSNNPPTDRLFWREFRRTAKIKGS